MSSFRASGFGVWGLGLGLRIQVDALGVWGL